MIFGRASAASATSPRSVSSHATARGARRDRTRVRETMKGFARVRGGRCFIGGSAGELTALVPEPLQLLLHRRQGGLGVGIVDAVLELVGVGAQIVELIGPLQVPIMNVLPAL